MLRFARSASISAARLARGKQISARIFSTAVVRAPSSAASYDDSSPYAKLVEQAAGSPQRVDLHGFFDRQWLEPFSVFDLAFVQHLCTGKYRTTWKSTGLMKDPVSLVQYTQLLQKVQPKTVFDLGTCGGGSALWLADQCRALGLVDTTVVSIDIQDLRPDDVKARMSADPNILFFESDAFQVASLVERVRAHDESPLAHPWLVSEDCHLDAFPLMVQFRFAGMRPGDYWVFEDTHPLVPDEAGMCAEKPDEYRTGQFARAKYRQLCWAMSAFPHEYAIDAELQDMFGHNASLLVNSVVQQVAPPTETVATVVSYRNVADLEQATATIEAAISAHGHCLLRYQGDAPVRPDSLVTQLRRTLRIAKPINYARAGGTDVRPAIDGSDAVLATDFPPTSAIPPHHELLYSPLCPERVGFVCVTKPDAGGETTIFDGCEALKVLEEGATRCERHARFLKRVKSGDRIWSRRVLCPPADHIDTANNTITDWSPLLGDVGADEAVDRARGMGFRAKLLTSGELQLDHAHSALCSRTGALNISAGSQAPVIYDVFYRDGSATAHRDIWWESDGAPLTEEEVLLSVAAYAQSRLYFEWERPGDAILLDNHRMAHGRMPYRGKRKVAVLTGNTD